MGGVGGKRIVPGTQGSHGVLIPGKKLMLRSVLTVAALAGAIILTAGVGTASAAAQPCWRTVINDWYDGQIDAQYPVHCYREALANAPGDLKMYSDLPADVNRALQSALRLQAISHPRTGGVDSARHSSNHSLPGRKASGPIGRVLSELGPSRADSLPVPLLVLAGMALLLIGAGAAGMVTRKLAARRVRSGPPR